MKIARLAGEVSAYEESRARIGAARERPAPHHVTPVRED